MFKKFEKEKLYTINMEVRLWGQYNNINLYYKYYL
jgi:hypothetical protein